VLSNPVVWWTCQMHSYFRLNPLPCRGVQDLPPAKRRREVVYPALQPSSGAAVRVAPVKRTVPSNEVDVRAVELEMARAEANVFKAKV
jgi:hypothetical protein